MWITRFYGNLAVEWFIHMDGSLQCFGCWTLAVYISDSELFDWED